MTRERNGNEELIRRWFEDLVDRKDLGALEAYCGETFYDHNPLAGATEGGVAAAREGFERLYRGMPDVQVRLEEILAEGDRVFVRAAFNGTHEGDLMGLRPTGKRLRMEVWHLFRLDDGKVVEHRAQSDLLAVLRQVAASPQHMADVILIPPRDVPTTQA
jgi:predicted ester cyclase